MYRTILVPVDGSALAEEAIPVAAMLAKRDAAALRLVHVHQLIPMIDGVQLPLEYDVRSAERDYVNRVAARAASEFSVTASGEALEGDVVGEIAGEAARRRADLVVMTTHGRTGFSRAWLGSVADAVMRLIDIPVLMLRPSDARHATMPIRCVVVPSDGSPLSSGVLTHAIALGGLDRCRYVLVRIVQPLPVPIGGAGYGPAAIVEDTYATEDAREAAAFEIEHLAETLRLEHPTLDVRCKVSVATNVAHELLRIITEEQANVVAIATHGRGLSRWALGSVADKLLRGGSTSMLMWHAAHQAKQELEASQAESLSAQRQTELSGSA